jgi:GT2 family glycosyltransferase
MPKPTSSLFTDDDVVLHERWLECLMAAFDAPEIMAVTGLVLPGELETQAQYIFETQWGFGRGYTRIDFDADFYRQHRAYGCPVWQIGAGASMAFRREIFERIGLFDERLDVGAAGCSGDSEYWNRILHHGFTCRYEPAATAFHFHRRSLDGLARQIRAYMSGHVAALLVQYQRTGEYGNLRRIVTSLPHYYLRRILRRLRHGRTAENYMLRQELLGCIDGLIFYLKAARPAALRESK